MCAPVFLHQHTKTRDERDSGILKIVCPRIPSVRQKSEIPLLKPRLLCSIVQAIMPHLFKII